MSYDDARAEYQRRYADWHRLQQQWTASWRDGKAPGLDLITALSLAERELRAASGAMHRCADAPSRKLAPVAPTLPDPHHRRHTAAVYTLATLAAGIAGALLGNASHR